MRRGVINGDEWITERLAFLRQMLDGDLSDELRAVVETEIAALSQERGITVGGRRVRRFWRHWFPGDQR